MQMNARVKSGAGTWIEQTNNHNNSFNDIWSNLVNITVILDKLYLWLSSLYIILY